VTDAVQDPEIPWDAIEAAFGNFRRAQEERAEAEQRLRRDRDSSDREAGRVFEESVGDLNHIVRRIRELEASAEEAVGQLAPFHGRLWDAPEAILDDGIPQERLGILLHDCEVAADELSQAAKEYHIARNREETRNNAVVLLIVLGIVMVFCVIFTMAAKVSGDSQHTTSPAVGTTATSIVVDRSDRISDSTAVGPPTLAAKTGTTTGANSPGSATPSRGHTPTAIGISPSPTSSPTSTPGAPERSGYDTSECSQSTGPTFRPLWARDRAALGCALEPQHGLVTAYQAFEHGYMIYRADQPDKGYALFEDGEWQAYSADWQDGMPEYSCPDDSTPSTTPPTPRRGFGFVWCHSAVVRQRLGWATMDELGNWRNFQAFQGGWAIELEQVADPPKMVLLDDGSWRWD
jgi:hypothetical protein